MGPNIFKGGQYETRRLTNIRFDRSLATRWFSCFVYASLTGCWMPRSGNFKIAPYWSYRLCVFWNKFAWRDSEFLLSPSFFPFSLSFLGAFFVILFGHHKHRYRASAHESSSSMSTLATFCDVPGLTAMRPPLVYLWIGWLILGSGRTPPNSRASVTTACQKNSFVKFAMSRPMAASSRKSVGATV